MAHAVSFPTAGFSTPSAGRMRPDRRTAAPARQGARPAVRRSGVRLTRRGRLVAFAASLLALVAIVLLSGRISAQAGDAGSATEPATTQVVVQSGENLWQIAQQVAPRVDPRAVVTAIRELNGLGTRPVVAGQSLVVPVYDAA